MALSYKTVHVYPSSIKQGPFCQLTVARNLRVIIIEQVGVVVTLSTYFPKVVVFGLGRKTDSGFSFFFLSFFIPCKHKLE